MFPMTAEEAVDRMELLGRVLLLSPTPRPAGPPWYRRDDGHVGLIDEADRPTDRRTDGPTDRRTDGPTDRLID
jgi:hypothetical protein